jgi:uncharacterized glyoxalase superfamily protein PhnB
MIINRSVPRAAVIPVLTYDDVAEASEWLCRAFGFKERLRMGDHRVQLVFADGAVIVTAGRTERRVAASPVTHAVHVHVDDADRHHEQAKRSGARILQPPTDYPYGERQYSALDLAGHHWTFSQSIADVDPATWGGTAIKTDSRIRSPQATKRCKLSGLRGGEHMQELVAWLGTPVGRFIRDLVEGAIAGAIAAVVALQLDVASPKVILAAAVTGAIAAAIAVARRAIVNTVSPTAPAQP